MLNITLPDGSQRQFSGPVTVAEVAASIGSGLVKAEPSKVHDVIAHHAASALHTHPVGEGLLDAA